MRNFNIPVSDFSACRSTKINKVLVPSYYLENSKSEELVLNCDFEIDEEEVGFVLKWHHNSVPIYQWIPQKKPYALVRNLLLLSFVTLIIKSIIFL